MLSQLYKYQLVDLSERIYRSTEVENNDNKLEFEYPRQSSLSMPHKFKHQS
jgi:hypothetical protein